PRSAASASFPHCAAAVASASRASRWWPSSNGACSGLRSPWSTISACQPSSLVHTAPPSGVAAATPLRSSAAAISRPSPAAAPAATGHPPPSISHVESLTSTILVSRRGPLLQHRRDRIQRPLRRPPLRGQQRPRGGADVLACALVRQHPPPHVSQLVRAAHAQRRPRGQELLGDGGEVLHV